MIKKKFMTAVAAAVMMIMIVPAAVCAADSTADHGLTVMSDRDTFFSQIGGVDKGAVIRNSEKIASTSDDQMYEELRTLLVESLDETKGAADEYKDSYCTGIKKEIDSLYNEAMAEVKAADELSTFEEKTDYLGLSLVDTIFGQMWMVDYEHAFGYDFVVMSELTEYWVKDYTKTVDPAANRTKVKASIGKYFKLDKSYKFNDYYMSVHDGMLTDYNDQVAAAAALRDLVLIRVIARDEATLMEMYTEYFEEPSIWDDDWEDWGISPDDFDDEDWDDDWDDDTEFEEDAWGPDDDWKIPEELKARVEGVAVNWYDFYSIADAKAVKKGCCDLIDGYIKYVLDPACEAGTVPNEDKVRAAAAEAKANINSKDCIGSALNDFDWFFEYAVDQCGCDFTYIGSRDYGLAYKQLHELYVYYFEDHLNDYSHSMQCDLYNCYAQAYVVMTEAFCKEAVADNYMDLVKAYMEKVPTVLQENQIKYVKLLKKYLNNPKYDQTKVKPIVNNGIAAINKAETVKAVKSAYNTYKAKADATVKKFSITTTKTGKGTVTAGKKVEYGKTFVVKITPASGYKLSKLYVDGKKVANTKNYMFRNVKKAHTLKAVFVKK